MASRLTQMAKDDTYGYVTGRPRQKRAPTTHGISNVVPPASLGHLPLRDSGLARITHLNPTAAVVWALCDGQRTVSDLVQATEVDEDAVRLALRKLEDANLLDGALSTEMRGKVQSRRSFMKKAAIAGAAVPVIASVSAPLASAAQSGEIISCAGDQCCNGPCKNAAGQTWDSTKGNNGPYTCIKAPKKCNN